MGSIQIDFFTRPGCCLCQEALQVLNELAKEFPIEVVTIDISTSQRLTDLYGNDIPVAQIEGQEIFRHRADKGELRSVLAGARGS